MTADVLSSRQTPHVVPHGATPAILAALGGAVAVGLLWIATAWASPKSAAQEVTTVQPAKGEFEVKYMVQDSASTASGATLGGVSAIEFHTNYIVVRQRDGSGRVFFNERTRELSWSPTPNKG